MNQKWICSMALFAAACIMLSGCGASSNTASTKTTGSLQRKTTQAQTGATGRGDYIPPEDIFNDPYTTTESSTLAYEDFPYENTASGYYLNGETSNRRQETTTSSVSRTRPATTVRKTTAKSTKPSTTSKANAPKLTTVKIKDVTFNYVPAYDYTATYTGNILRYDLKVNIEYCEPKAYMKDTDGITGIYRSNGQYTKDEIGSVYKSAGTDDFAIYKIEISGSYIDQFYGSSDIAFCKYTEYGSLLRNAAGKTEFDVTLQNPKENVIDETFYIGFYRSEVARVDFILFGVGPNGIG